MLFSPMTLGDLELPNRLVMAPLTRVRSGQEGIPGPLVVEHYRQRASLGLIVSEGTYPSRAGRGFPGQPGLVTEEQLAGWSDVTSAVHAEGGRIFAQVMHAGRVTHAGHHRRPRGRRAQRHRHRRRDPHLRGQAAVPGPARPRPPRNCRASSRNSSRRPARRSAAGFDGVELHSANGYLLHEFLAPSANQRDDVYGGSPENRARFVIEVAQAVVDAIGADRVGIRISPEHNVQGALELDAADVRATYGHLVDALAPLKLAYLSILHKDPTSELVQDLRARFDGTFLINTGFGVVTTRDEAIALVADGHADAVVVGRPAIANPDLVRRWREGLPVNEADPATFYTEGAEGYTDYPAYQN